MLGYIFVTLALIYFIWGLRVTVEDFWDGLGVIMLGFIWVRFACDFFK